VRSAFFLRGAHHATDLTKRPAIVAAALGRKLGVAVRVAVPTAKTDGGVIVLRTCRRRSRAACRHLGYLATRRRTCVTPISPPNARGAAEGPLQARCRTLLRTSASSRRSPCPTPARARASPRCCATAGHGRPVGTRRDNHPRGARRLPAAYATPPRIGRRCWPRRRQGHRFPRAGVRCAVRAAARDAACRRSGSAGHRRRRGARAPRSQPSRRRATRAGRATTPAAVTSGNTRNEPDATAATPSGATRQKPTRPHGEKPTTRRRRRPAPARARHQPSVTGRQKRRHRTR